MGTRLFSFPKSTAFMSRVIDLLASDTSLVLDSFAGSGTTAHAVLALNKADGGNRKFILVETEDYADTLTAERVRRVIGGVPAAKDPALKEGLGGSFTYVELGEPMDLARFFAGEGAAPTYERVAEYVAYTATGAGLTDAQAAPSAETLWYAGEAGGARLHLIYRPDAQWMASDAAALTADLADAMRAAADGKPVLAFAAQKFVSQKALGADVTYCQLPYSIHRLMGEPEQGTGLA